jgi:transposase
MDTTKLFAAALGLVAPWHVVAAEFQPGTPTTRGQLELRIDFTRGGALPCPTCGVACKAYDTAPQRWRHLNFFEHETYLHARVPRVQCATHGVGTVAVPWARAGSGFTLLFEAYVLALVAAMPMAALARLLGENDTRLWRIVQWHVADARRRVDMHAVTSVVVDETSRAKYHHYVSLFLEPRTPAARGAGPTPARPARVLYVTDGRSHTAFHDFVADLTAHGGAPARITDVCMDLSPAYARGAAEALPAAAVTFDRFHVMQVVGKALDDVRRREQRQHPELKRSRYVWLTNPPHLSVAQRALRDRLSQTHLLTAQAYQMRLNLQALWERPTAGAAARYLAGWCAWVETAAARPADPTQPWVLEAMARAAQTLRTHAAGILNYFRRHLTSGVIEAVNGLAQAARARARGYRNPATFKTIIYLLAGRLRFDLPNLATHTR